MNILLIILFFLFLTYALAGMSAAPWVPSRTKICEKIIAELPENKSFTFYDLGCGTGELLFLGSQKCPQAKFIGCEISLIPYLFAKFKKLIYFQKYKNVKIKYKNLFKENITKADFVFIFLLNKAYPRLIKKFKNELNPECLVFIEAWPLPKIKPVKEIPVENNLTVYIYQNLHKVNK